MTATLATLAIESFAADIISARLDLIEARLILRAFRRGEISAEAAWERLETLNNDTGAV